VCRWLAQQLAPLVAQLAMHVAADSVLESATGDDRLFRREAAAAHATRGRRGDVVRVSPKWIGWSYWLVVVLLAAAGAFVIIARVPDYSSGIAVINQSDRSEVVAPVSGNLVDIHVKAGEMVEAGQLLATFYAPSESTQLKALESEWEAALRAYLSNRAEVNARTTVANIRSRREQLLDKLAVRADRPGVVSQPRVEVGQKITVGDSVMSIDHGGRMQVIAFLPGADRPQLREGMSLRLQLDGYPRDHLELIVSSIGNDVIGPNEAQRRLGPQLAGSVPVTGSVVLVFAELASSSFEVDGEALDLTHGMKGLAEVELRSERIIKLLIPGMSE
jgi:membrane fusion protein (multidrug efflux system)